MTTGEAARAIGVHPRLLSDLIYRSRVLSTHERIELVGGRRVIHPDAMPAIATEARRAGLLPPIQTNEGKQK